MRSILLASLLTASAVRARASLDELFHQMHHLQQEIEQTMWENLLQPARSNQTTQPFTIHFQENTETLTITIKGIELSSEKPDFSFDADQQNRTIELDVAFATGAVEIRAQENVVAVSCECQKIEEINNRKQSSHRIFQQSFRLTAPIGLNVPKITYHKEDATMTIELALEQQPQKKTKLTYPIDLK